MNKANFTFFHLNGIGKTGVRVATSLFLFFSLFISVNVSAQTLSCNGHLNISVDPETCEVVLTPATVGVGGSFVRVDGINPAYISGNNSEYVVIYADLIPQFIATGSVTGATYSLFSANGANSCWGTFLIEDKAAPLIFCPEPTTISCADYDDYVWVQPEVDECTGVTWSWSDFREEGEECGSEVIVRYWTATDARGNYASCAEILYLEAEDLSTLELPDNYSGLGDLYVYYGQYLYLVEDAGTLSCDGAGTEWNVVDGVPSPDDKIILNANGTVKEIIPGTGYPGGVGSCGMIHASYDDLVIDICDADCAQSNGSFKVVRTWTILDWCTGGVLEHNQIIKVLDDEAPEIDEIANVTISTDLWGCGATYRLPAVSADDNCSTELHVEFTAFAYPGMEYYYGMEVARPHAQYAIGTIVNNVLYIPDGLTLVLVFAEVSDCCGNTSYESWWVRVQDLVPPVVVADAHTVVSLSQFNSNGLAKVFASTFDDGSFDGCGDITMSVRRMDTTCPDFEEEDGDIASTSGFDNLWFDYVHFCCEDIRFDDAGNQIPVTVVFRVCDEGGLCNTAMVEVMVQDKLAPACAAPANTTINCIDAVAYQDLINAGPLSAADAAKIDARFGDAAGAATCNVTVVQELTSTEECGFGKVTRKIIVTNVVNGLSVTCTQIIDIVADEDVNFLTCDDITFPVGSAEYEVFKAHLAKRVGTSSPLYPDGIWCLMNPDNIGDTVEDGEDLPAIEVADCAGVSITPPQINIDNLCSEVGLSLTLDTFNFAGGGCKKILAHWEVIDQCIFEENYLYYNGGRWEINPFVAENGYFEMYVEYDLFDTEGPVITCGEGQTVGCGDTFTGAITASATDNCTDPAFFGWSWKLDVGNDNSYNASGEGNSVTPAMLGLTAFPAGTHRITWIVSDGCGNISSQDCIFGLDVEDNKAPTPYCYDGLSSAVMLMGGVELWASDFDAGSFDACSDVTVTMIPDVDTEGLSNADAFAASAASWTFGCDYIPNGVAATIDVRIYVVDASGNYDYCLASFRLQDNLGGCEDVEGALSAIGGNIATESGEMVSGVEVEAMTANPEFPKYATTSATGEYAFYSNPTYYNYEISSVKNDDYLNGVSTLDLVIIQKHILGIEALDSPYKRIAADINNDADIKASDLLQLRKLILGLYTADRLPSNGSWRFVDADYTFADAANPFPFDEVINVENLSTDMMAENFLAVKVGDVNGSVQANANSNAQVRTNKAVTFELNNASYAAGEVVEVDFRSSDFNNVFGYQFTLEFANMTFTGIKAGALDVTEANFGLNRINEGVITTSYDNVRGVTVSSDEVLFTLTFTANTATELSNAISINSSRTAAEAYVGEGLEVNNVNVAFRNNEGAEVANTYALFQNEPNPFKGVTNISFNLPEAANATLSVYDVTGKVIYRTSADYAKGLNTVRVENLSASGVLYYQLDSNDFTATKKMIIIE